MGETSTSTSPAAGDSVPPHLQYSSKTNLQPCLESVGITSMLRSLFSSLVLAEYKLLTGNAGWKHTPSQLKSLEAYMRHTFV